MHICQICKKAPAVIHLTDIHNNMKTEVHMCEQCAAEKGFNLQSTAKLPQLLGLAAKKKAEQGNAEDDLVCGKCGSKWSEFKSRGRLGCPADYEAFRSKLEPMILGTLAGEAGGCQSFHVGKKPGIASTDEGTRKKILSAEKMLKTAVAEERYEDAAKLRDELNALHQILSPSDREKRSDLPAEAAGL